MEGFSDNHPERVPDEMGIRLEDIDKDVLITVIRIYFEEARGIKPEDMDEGELLNNAFTTGMLRPIGNGEMEVRVYEDAEFRFGSMFSRQSKLCFRRAYGGGMVWMDFDDNLTTDPPQEYYEAKKRFKTRVGEYLVNRDIAVPIYR